MRTSASGVFSSWETLATKSLLSAARRRSFTEATTTMTTPAMATSAAKPTMPTSITRCALDVGPELLGGGERHLEAPVVERGGEGAADGELAALDGRAEDDAPLLVDHVHAARAAVDVAVERAA